VSFLQPLEFVGAIFTKAAKDGDLKGHIRGTLSFNSIHWDHQRAADILVDVNWDNRKNSAGYAGASYSKGVAGHGSISPYEVHIPLLASGPAFKNTVESNLPTSNVDLVPTVLYIQGIDIPASMDGRVMSELLRKPGKYSMQRVKKEVIETVADYPGGSYHLTMERSVMGKYQYVNFAKVIRKAASN
jgi:arylsulfatase A-like enzyme